MQSQTTLSLTDRAAAFNAANPGQHVTRQDLGKLYKRLRVRKKKVRKKKANPRKYPPEEVTRLASIVRNAALDADTADRWIWNVDEIHFKLSDHVLEAWAMPCDLPEVVERPMRGSKTASVIVAVAVRTGDMVWEIGRKFQKQDDICRFVAKICAETPPEKKVAMMWDNASSHRARTVRLYLESLDVTDIKNVPYSPFWNGIEHVFSDVRLRY